MPSFTAQHIRDAFVSIRQNGIPEGFGPSTKWDIVDEMGERYPPKAVLYLAKGLAGDSSYSGGGGDQGTNNAIRERGFVVSLKAHLDNSETTSDVEAIINSGSDPTSSRTRKNGAALGIVGSISCLRSLDGG